MKKCLTKEQADNLISLGVDVRTHDMSIARDNKNEYKTYLCRKVFLAYDAPTWSLPALINIFPCGKNDPIFNLTRGGYPDGTYSRNWYASYEDLDRNILFVNDAEEPIDAVYELLCELLKEHKL